MKLNPEFSQDLMMFLNWTRAAILYEDEYGLIRYKRFYLCSVKVYVLNIKNLEVIYKTRAENFRMVDIGIKA